MPSEFQKKSSEFAKKCFDDIREMSKDGQGVSRQGYSPVETRFSNILRKSETNLILKFLPIKPEMFG